MAEKFASEQLQMAAQEHVGYLKGLKKDDLSLEQWYRIQKLFDKWKGGDKRRKLALEIIKEISR